MSTEILRPNAAGDETNLKWYEGTGHDPDPDYNYTMVDEEVSDGDTTRVQSYNADNNWRRDLYNLPAHSGSGTINSITVYANALATNTPDQTSLKVACKSGTTVAEGDEETVAESYTLYSKQWTTNPDTSSPWTWDEIDSLQIGVNLRRCKSGSAWGTRCTQVYVEVDYTSSATSKTSSDTGSGVEGTTMPSAILAGSETGSGIEAFVARLLAAFDTGYGVEAVVEVGGQLKNLFASELGEGADGLTAKIEIPNKGGGMRLWT